jgi:hypothetical protein
MDALTFTEAKAQRLKITMPCDLEKALTTIELMKDYHRLIFMKADAKLKASIHEARRLLEEHRQTGNEVHFKAYARVVDSILANSGINQ